MNTWDEGALRRKAHRLGYSIRKSREWKLVPHIDNWGEYMLVDDSTNMVVLGGRFDATLDDICEYLSPVNFAKTLLLD